MNSIFVVMAIAALLASVVPSVSGSPLDDGPGRWTVEKANAWQKHHGWLVGCNFAPAYSINELEMWQPDTFNLEAIDHELGLAQSLGFNSVRVFLHDLLWEQDSKGLLHRMDLFLAAADRRHIGVMFVLFDSCWDPFPVPGKQREPKPHVHNSGWVQAPGQLILKDPSKYPALKPYVVGLLSHFRHDRRIHCWDLFNEPDNSTGNSYSKVEIPDKAERALDLIKLTWRWSREVNPDQPLTAGIWYGEWDSDTKLNAMQRFCLENSDVITFHDYGKAEDLERHIGQLKRFNRPVLCTEYMARPQGSTFSPNLAMMKREHVGAYNWGFVSGKTQTIYPWDSWTTEYTAEPPLWFHDIFRTDGTPYRSEEVEYIRQVTGAGKR